MNVDLAVGGIDEEDASGDNLGRRIVRAQRPVGGSKDKAEPASGKGTEDTGLLSAVEGARKDEEGTVDLT